MIFDKMGKDLPFGLNTSVPNMADTLDSWLQPLTFNLVVKTVENSEVIETTQNVSFLGVWQPLSFKQLILKPEHQRAWSWWKCHSKINVNLNVDDVIKFRGEQFRVMALGNYDLYGFWEYDLVRDFEGAGPNVTPVVDPGP